MVFMWQDCFPLSTSVAVTDCKSQIRVSLLDNLHYGNNAPGLKHPHSPHKHCFLLSPACKWEDGQQWKTALCCSSGEKNKVLHVFWKKFCFLICRFYKGRVALQAYNWHKWIKFLTLFHTYCMGKNRDMHIKMLKMLTYSYSFRTWVTLWSS